jgi:hypothetical protein
MAEKWFLLTVDQQMKYEDELKAAYPTKIRDMMLNIRTTDEDDLDNNEEEEKESVVKRVAIPIGSQTTDEAEEEESDLAEEWIRVPVDAESRN